MVVTIRWMSHATFQIRAGDQIIYIDPTTKNTGLKEKDFVPADIILVTHEHADHCDPGLLKKIRKLGSPIIAPEGAKKAIGKAGVVWDLAPGQFMQMGDGKTTVTAVPAYNVKRFRKPGEPFHPKGLGVGYILKVEGKRIYHAGDTDLIPEMEKLPEIDVALLPAGDTYTMDFEEAAQAAKVIRPAVAIPMHLWDKDPSAFVAMVESDSDTKVVILGKGEEYTLE
jgi:L-ascorbate metabolism protein UlaG (beta-lactamase superfamily)